MTSESRSSVDECGEDVKPLDEETAPIIAFLRQLVSNASQTYCAMFLGVIVIRVCKLIMELCPANELPKLLRDIADFLDRKYKEEP